MVLLISKHCLLYTANKLKLNQQYFVNNQFYTQLMGLLKQQTIQNDFSFILLGSAYED